MYTKHLKQNVKTWEEGLLSYNPVSKKLALFTRDTRASNKDTIFLVIKPDFEVDE